ncbi:unnamed protein product [Oncorhynchus mykiss]|uniref:G-protein coupled receptors family 1 profile domain-containing protein n=1 Tax=Oncorhynchus mykiss TaxID=8022 RepID=A0A060Z8W7_ONCMY|nr:unnamed protein product [Oncorhynchus mykiss]
MHMHARPRGRPHAGRIWTPRRPLGVGSRLPGDGVGVGVCVRGERAAVDPGSRAVWHERDVRTGLRKGALTREHPYVRVILPHPLSHPGIPPSGQCGRVRFLPSLPALPLASPLLPSTLLSRLPLSLIMMNTLCLLIVTVSYIRLYWELLRGECEGLWDCSMIKHITWLIFINGLLYIPVAFLSLCSLLGLLSLGEEVLKSVLLLLQPLPPASTHSSSSYSPETTPTSCSGHIPRHAPSYTGTARLKTRWSLWTQRRACVLIYRRRCHSPRQTPSTVEAPPFNPGWIQSDYPTALLPPPPPPPRFL